VKVAATSESSLLIRMAYQYVTAQLLLSYLVEAQQLTFTHLLE
jgi:hypothetical protein